MLQNPFIKGENLRKYLPKHQKSKGNHSYQQDMLRIGKQYFTYINLDFPFSNQEKGSIYVLRKISPYVGIINRIFPFLIFLLLILVIVIIGFLNYLVSRSIIKPIRELKEAAEKIKQQNKCIFSLYRDRVRMNTTFFTIL